MDAYVVQGISQASSLILYAQGPGLEPFTDYKNFPFDWRCKILFYANDNGVQYSRSISTLELLRFHGNNNTTWKNQPGTVILYRHYPECITTSQPNIKFSDNNHGYINLTVTYTWCFTSHCGGKMSTSQFFHIEQHIDFNTLYWDLGDMTRSEERRVA